MAKLFSALIVEYGYIKLVLFEKRSGSFVYYAEKDLPYGGFDEYGFVNPEEVFTKVQQVFEFSEGEFGTIDRNTIVVLPGAFYKYSLANAQTTTSDGIVKTKDVNSIYDSCGARLPGYEPVEKIPVGFKTAVSPSTLTPLGEKSAILEGTISVGYLKRAIKELFDNCSKRTGREFTYTSYISFIADKAERKLLGRVERAIIIIADGHIDIAIAKGTAPTDMRSELWGEGHLVYSLAQFLSVDESVAKQLINGVNLTLSNSESTYYLCGENIPSKAINPMVIETVEFFAKSVKNALTEMNAEDIPIYITGSDLCERRGVKEIFEDELRRNVELLNSDIINVEGCGKYLIAAIQERYRLCAQ